jgi:hypothetical protein
MKTPALLGLLAIVAMLALFKPQPIHSHLADLVPTPDPCGYRDGTTACVKHRLVCPVF